MRKEKICIAEFSRNEMFRSLLDRAGCGASGSLRGGAAAENFDGRYGPVNAVPETTGFSAVRSQRQRPFSVF